VLNLLGRSRSNFCDGLSRRDFLQVGALALGGLTFADLLRLRARGAVDPKAGSKAAIMIFLSGGPSHIDTWDMKPDAPAEIRGEFKPIKTSVPGIEWCEYMPLLATMADKVAVLRGVHTVGNHTGNEFFSGFAWEQGKPDGVNNQKRPAVGSVVSRLRGGSNGMPAYVSLHDNATWEHPYYLGAAHRPFRSHTREKGNQGLANLSLAPGLTLDTLRDRRSLLHSFDGLRRNLDVGGAFEAVDSANARALEIITSGRVRDAFDLSKEPDRLKARYGTAPAAFDFVPGQEFLLARRLVEAGVPVVSLAVHGWDTHEKNFETLKKQLPIIDRALSALLTDLEMRGLLKDVAIIMGGEMGRTPLITRERAGREHWPDTGVTLMAGGGLKTGQVVGASDSKGASVKGRAITPQMMIATLYQALGIDPSATVADNTGRPIYLLDEREPIPELV
jgi:hypothetical protein